MAGNLPASLLDETGQTLQRVVGVQLPAERWESVVTAMKRIDTAVQGGEAGDLKQGLDQLRRAAQAPGRRGDQPTSKPQVVGTAIADMPPSVARPAPLGVADQSSARKTHRPWFSAWWWVIGAAICSLVVAITVETVVSTDDVSPSGPLPTRSETTKLSAPPPTDPSEGPFETSVTPPWSTTGGTSAQTATTGATTTTPTAAPPATSAPPSSTDTAPEVDVAAILLVALAAAVVIVSVVVHVRRKRNAAPSPPIHAVTTAPRPFVDTPPLVPAPRDVVEFANRTILSLSAHGGGS